MNEIKTTNPNGLIELAIEKGDIATIEKMVALQERWEAKESRKMFYEALSKFQGECPVVENTKHGYDQRYSYTPLAEILKAVAPLIAENSLSYRWEQSEKDGKISITCVVTHTSGHSERMTLTAPQDSSGGKNAIQSIGSTVSYLRRYTLTGLLGVGTADQDNDGANGAKAPEIPEHVVIDIDKCKTKEALVAYAETVTHLNKIPRFRELCKAKLATLKA